VKGTSEDKLLADYILGTLPDPDQRRLEDEYLSNSHAQDQLLIVEDELVDAYVRGELSADERKQLEDRFLASPRGRRKLELAKSLMTLASEARRKSEQVVIAAPKPFRLVSIRRMSAAAALVLVFALAWSIRGRIKSRPGAESAGGRQGPMNRQAPPATPDRIAPYPAERPSGHPQLPAIASVVLTPVARNIEQSQRVRLPAGVLAVKIQLKLQADHHKSYKATLLGAGDAAKWSGRGLKTQPTPSGRTIVLKLPATLFENGEYTLLLSPDMVAAKPIAEYTFIIQKK
jgi:hypothetical protein